VEAKRESYDVAATADDPFGGARGSDGRLLSSYDEDDVAAEGRRIVASYLERRGYELIDACWECQMGSAIVARKEQGDPDDTCGGVVLVEVDPRLRFGADPGEVPELSVDDARRSHLKLMALLYLAHNITLPYVRCDVVALDIISERTARMRHLVSAFCWEW